MREFLKRAELKSCSKYEFKVMVELVCGATKFAVYSDSH